MNVTNSMDAESVLLRTIESRFPAACLIGASAFMDAMGAWRFDLKVIAFLLYVMHTIGVGVAVKLFVELVDWVRGVAYRKSKIRR